MRNRVGAPKGGRVHWLIYNLPADFKNSYIINYQYSLHQYVFYRMSGKFLYDCFIVKRTSRRYFRAVYINVCYNEVEFFGDYKSVKIAEKMYDLYLIDKNRNERG